MIDVLGKTAKNPLLKIEKGLTSREFLERFSVQEITLLTAWLHAKSSQTQRLYKRIAVDFFNSFESLTIKETELGHGLLYIKRNSHLKQSSQNLARDVLCSLFSFCVKSGYLEASPFVTLERFKVPDTFGSKVLEENEIKRMIEEEKNPRNQLMLRLLYETGIRVSEMAKIKKGDFSLRPDGNALLMVVGKGAKVRGVVVREKLMQKIECYISTLPFALKEKDYLFSAKRNYAQHLAVPQIYRIVRAAAQRCGIEKEVSPHWFRHSSATHALERGAPVHVVKATLGHESLATTGKYLDRRPRQSNSDFLPEF